MANCVTLPIVIGQIYQLPSDEIISLMQRTFLAAGVGSFLQGWLGHRLPGIVLGCLLYYVLGKGGAGAFDAKDDIGLPQLLACGAPRWDAGMVVSSVIIGLILVSNTIAMPSVFRYVFGNGLIFGTIIAIVLERVWREKRKETS